jgi:hypothetical protein
MQWIVFPANSEILAVHATLMASPSGSGGILYFAGDEHDRGQHERHQWDHSRLFDCATGAITNPGSPPSNRAYYRVGWDLDTAGNVTGGWSAPTEVPGWFGAENQGAGVAAVRLRLE